MNSTAGAGMKIAVMSVVVFDVNDEASIDDVARDFKAANEWAIGRAMVTVTGQAYVMRAIEQFEVTRRV